MGCHRMLFTTFEWSVNTVTNCVGSLLSGMNDLPHIHAKMEKRTALKIVSNHPESQFRSIFLTLTFSPKKLLFIVTVGLYTLQASAFSAIRFRFRT